MSLLARLQEGPPSPLRQDVVDARLSWLAMGRGDPRVALGAAGWQEKMLDEMDAKHEIARADAMEEKKDTLVREIIEWDTARYGYFPRPTAGVSHDSRVERLNEVRCDSLPPWTPRGRKGVVRLSCSALLRCSSNVRVGVSRRTVVQSGA